jgi:hypothetical protein
MEEKEEVLFFPNTLNLYYFLNVRGPLTTRRKITVHKLHKLQIVKKCTVKIT